MRCRSGDGDGDGSCCLRGRLLLLLLLDGLLVHGLLLLLRVSCILRLSLRRILPWHVLLLLRRLLLTWMLLLLVTRVWLLLMYTRLGRLRGVHLPVGRCRRLPIHRSTSVRVDARPLWRVLLGSVRLLRMRERLGLCVSLDMVRLRAVRRIVVRLRAVCGIAVRLRRVRCALL